MLLADPKSKHYPAARHYLITIYAPPRKGPKKVLKIDLNENSHDHKVYCSATYQDGSGFDFMMTRKELDSILRFAKMFPDMIMVEDLGRNPD